METMKAERLAAIEHQLEMQHIAGTCGNYANVLKMVASFELPLSEIAAFMSGMASETFDVEHILQAVKTAHHEDL
jgi:hypothetical protein